MSLFNYGECKNCQPTMNDTKLVLSHILPSNVCSKISEYNVYCNQCCITRDLEKFFVKEHKDKGYTKFQLQLKFFMKHQNRFPVCFYHKIARKSFEKEVDIFFENEDLIRRFGGANKIKPYKAFVKKHRELFEMIDWHLLSKDKIKEVLQEFGANKHCVWYYYNIKYRICLLIYLFFWEYIYAIIGEDNIKYVEKDDIDKYLDCIFEDLLPDWYFDP